MSKKKTKTPIETPTEALFPVLNRMTSFDYKGKKVKAPAFQVAFLLCYEKAMAGDAKAKAAFDKILDIGGYFTAPAEGRKVEPIVVRAPARSTAEWVEVAKATYMAVNPLEGVPGAEDITRGRQGRDPVEEDF